MTRWVYGFGAGDNDGRAEMKNLLGGKGANLAEMASIGLPVPPGFTLTTEVCTAFYTNQRKYPSGLEQEVSSALARVEMAFAERFGKPLPVSANGETAVHRALGFDHRGRVDVAVQPDQPEGVWLRQFLTENRIPYFAFRQAVPGKATGAHIHIGPMSTRLVPGG